MFCVYCEEAERYLNRNFEQFHIHYCRVSEFILLCFGYFDPHYFGRRRCGLTCNAPSNCDVSVI